MARVVQTDKIKKKKRKNVVLIVIIVLILVVSSVLLCLKFFKKKPPERERSEIKIIDSMTDYGYSLKENDSAYYKQEYENLKNIVNASEIDMQEYATQVAKMFVIDLYTLSTKMNKYDIGGVSYYHADRKNMYEQKVMDRIYSTLEDNTYGDRKQSLPEVSSVSVLEVSDIKYKVHDVQDCLLVKLTWNYVTNMGYDNEGSVVVCDENSVRWSVVDFQPTLKPEYKQK